MKRTSGQVVVSLLATTALIVIAVLGLGSWSVVPTGHVGIVTRMGHVTGRVATEGVTAKTPWLETVNAMSIQVIKEEVKVDAASRDLQAVTAVVAANIRLSPAHASRIFQEVGMGYLDVIVAPAMSEAIKASVAAYTAEECITKRELVKEGIHTLLAAKLESRGIIIDTVNITDFDFSKSFNEAIEMKVTAEQNALASKNLLEQKKYEAQQAVVTAQGKADSIAIESKALANSPQILQLRALEKWNGTMPLVIGGDGAMPFININGGNLASAVPSR